MKITPPGSYLGQNDVTPPNVASGGGSGVTSVTGTSPVASSGGTTSDISLPAEFPTWFGASPPSDPVQYPYWQRNSDGAVFYYYTDADSSQWVQFPAGAGIPQGGTTGQILTKIDGTDFNVDWEDAPAVPVPTGTGFAFLTSGALDSTAKSALDAANLVSSIAQTGLIVPAASVFTTFGTGITLADKVGRLQATVTDAGVLRGGTLNSISTPYTIDVGISLVSSPLDTDATYAGLVLSDGTKFAAYYAGLVGAGSSPAQVGTPRWSRDSWTNSTTFSATVRKAPIMLNSNLYFLRITDNGTTRTFYLSANYKDFLQVYSEATNTFVTPTKFGIGFYNNSPNGENLLASIRHWLVSNSVLGDAP